MSVTNPSFITVSKPVWRILWAKHPNHALKAALAPEGRFHHDNQTALYASLSATGAGVALNYYLRPDDDPRIMCQLHLESQRIIDASDQETAHQIGFAINDTTWRWQNDRKLQIRPRTWDVSDKIRDLGADGMIFRSSQHPDLRHIVLFRWNTTGSASLTVGADLRPWDRDGPNLGTVQERL